MRVPHHAATVTSAKLSFTNLSVDVSVADSAIRASHPTFDGFEKVTALVPNEKSGALTWDRHALQYAGSYTPPSRYTGPGDFTSNRYTLRLAAQHFDPAAVARHGIALMLDTNVGELWMQGPGENLRPALA